MEIKISPPFRRFSFDEQDEATKQRLALLCQVYRTLEPRPLPYFLLTSFEFIPRTSVRIRNSIADAVKLRTQPSCSLGLELSVLALLQKRQSTLQGNVYDALCTIRAYLFPYDEPLRRHRLSIKHLPWLRIPPPSAEDVLFAPLESFHGPNPLWDALNLYFAALIAHPFSDGNGRATRILFNAFLRERVGHRSHIVPLAELLRMTGGAYEEMLARSHEQGDYLPTFKFMVDLLDQYFEHVCRCKAAKKVAPLTFIRANACRDFRARQFDLNRLSPFSVSLHDLSDASPARAKPIAMLEAAAGKLREFGEIEYAMTNLSVIDGTATENSVAFFVATKRKEDLQAAFREIRHAFPELKNLELIVKTNDFIIDAKVLINMSTFYISDLKEKGDALILIYDFD